MQTAIFYGSSDDLIEIEGVKGGDEFGAYQRGEGLVHASFILGGKMRIYALYDGCWSFAIAQVDEGVALPDWPIRINTYSDSRGVGYSTRMEILVPDDVTVFREADKS